ncbi:hypothetical protein [Carnimonas bestiolae]
MPEEKQAIAALAQEEARTASSMVRLLALKGLEQYNNQSQRTH